jgi:hypothetical protein
MTYGETEIAAPSPTRLPRFLAIRLGGLPRAFWVVALLGPLGGSRLLGHGSWLPWLICAALCAPAAAGALALAPAVRGRRPEGLTV